MKTDLFQSCGHCWVFQICWHMEWSTFTALCFRIWNSSAGIQSPPLALVIVMLPKAHLTSHSRMPGSRWVITPSWLSGSWITFLYSSSVLFPWRTKWQPTPVSLPGESHGRRSLVGYSPQVAKSRTRLSDFTFTFQFHALEKEVATHSSILAWKISMDRARHPGMWSQVGLRKHHYEQS